MTCSPSSQYTCCTQLQLKQACSSHKMHVHTSPFCEHACCTKQPPQTRMFMPQHACLRSNSPATNKHACSCHNMHVHATTARPTTNTHLLGSFAARRALCLLGHNQIHLLHSLLLRQHSCISLSCTPRRLLPRAAYRHLPGAGQFAWNTQRWHDQDILIVFIEGGRRCHLVRKRRANSPQSTSQWRHLHSARARGRDSVCQAQQNADAHCGHGTGWLGAAAAPALQPAPWCAARRAADGEAHVQQ